MRECPHGIVAGTCTFCMAEGVKVEQNAIEDIRVAFREAEERKAVRICAGPGCTFGPGGVKHGQGCNRLR